MRLLALKALQPLCVLLLYSVKIVTVSPARIPELALSYQF